MLPFNYISNKVLFNSFHTHIPEFSVFWLSPRKGMLSSFFLKYFDSSPKFSPLEIKKLIKDFKQLTLTVDRNTFGKIKKRLEVELLSSYEFYNSNINNAWFSQIRTIYNSFSGNVLLSCRHSQKINSFIKGKCNRWYLLLLICWMTSCSSHRLNIWMLIHFWKLCVKLNLLKKRSCRLSKDAPDIPDRTVHPKVFRVGFSGINISMLWIAVKYSKAANSVLSLLSCTLGYTANIYAFWKTFKTKFWFFMLLYF